MTTTEHDRRLSGFEHPDEPGAPLDGPAAPREPSSSLMGRLRAQRDEIARRKTTTFPLPGYNDPQLVPEFRLLGSDELKLIGQKIRRQFDDEQDRLFNGLIDQTLAACTQIFIRERDADALVLLDPDGLGPMRFDQRLAELLAIDAETARGTLLGVFNGNDVAVFAYCQRLAEWMGNTSVKLDEAAAPGEA